MGNGKHTIVLNSNQNRFLFLHRLIIIMLIKGQTGSISRGKWSRMIDLPEYQFKHFEKHSALLLGIIHIVNGSAERL